MHFEVYLSLQFAISSKRSNMILLTKDHLTRDTKDKITSKGRHKGYINTYVHIYNAFKYIPFIGTKSEYVL